MAFVVYIHLSFKKKVLPLVFIGLYSFTLTFSTIHIDCYHLLCNPFSIKQESTFWGYALLITILLYLFICGIHWPLLLLCFVWSGYIHLLLLSSSPSFYFHVWTIPFVVFNSLASKALYSFFFSFLLSHFYFTFHSTLYYSTHQYFKLIFGNYFPLLFSNIVPTVTDQILELSTTETLSLLFFFQFCSQFGKGLLLIEHVTHKLVILFKRHSVVPLKVEQDFWNLTNYNYICWVQDLYSTRLQLSY